MTENFNYEAALAAENQWRDLVTKGDVAEFQGVDWHEPFAVEQVLCGICGASVDDHIASRKAHEDFHLASHRCDELNYYRLDKLSAAIEAVSKGVHGIYSAMVALEEKVSFVDKTFTALTRKVNLIAKAAVKPKK